MSNLTVSAVNEFKGLWTSGMESILKACKVYVKAIDSDENAKEQFKKALPKISDTSWNMIEQTGRGQLHYLLLCDSSEAAKKLRKLPYSEQQKAIDIGFEVLTESGDVLNVKSENLTSLMINQVIAKDHIRDISAQRAYIESSKIANIPKSNPPKDLYIVRKSKNGKYIQVLADTTFNLSQALQLVKDLSN